MQGAKDSAAKNWNQTLSEAEKKSEEVKGEVKSTWASWFGWGKSKADEAESKGAEKLAEGAESAKKGADNVKASAEKRV